jgi:hypothetical protein
MRAEWRVKISYHPHSGWFEEALPGRAINGEGSSKCAVELSLSGSSGEIEGGEYPVTRAAIVIR